jgi:RNA polymerase sigma-70 factor (ECF subfamily)
MSEDTPNVLFPTTCWSRLGVEAGAHAADARAALETLAQSYAGPIEAYLRQALRRSREDARDLAQDFFLWMIETDFLAKADPARGRFRAFIKVALRNYVTDEDRKRSARKRGGEIGVGSLEGESAASDVVDPKAKTPEQTLDEAWRAALVENALAAVEDELRAQGREVVFLVFRDYFLDRAAEIDYRTVASRHAITTAQVSNHLAQAKALYRAKLKAMVLDTVRSDRDLADELEWLFGKEARR